MPPHKPIILNDFSSAEIEAARQRVADARARKYRHCLFCDKEFLMKENQKFCSTAHKNAYHKLQAEILLQALIHEKQEWLKERDDFVKEIARLKEQLDGKA